MRQQYPLLLSGSEGQRREAILAISRSFYGLDSKGRLTKSESLAPVFNNNAILEALFNLLENVGDERKLHSYGLLSNLIRSLEPRGHHPGCIQASGLGPHSGGAGGGRGGHHAV